MTSSPLPLLDVRELSVKFHTPHGAFTAVDNISFSLKPGETIALLGESGSGKTTAAQAISCLLPPKLSILSGSISLNTPNHSFPILQHNTHLDKNSILQLHKHTIGVIFQEPIPSLNPLHSIRKQLSEALTISAQPTTFQPSNQDILQLLEQVQLSALASRLDNLPHQLSGGQCQRIMIAIALAKKPKLLIADEPTTSLDVSTRSHILDLLLSIQQQQNLSLIFITHDLHIARYMSQNTLVMDKGKIVEEGPTHKLFSQPKTSQTKNLIHAHQLQNINKKPLPKNPHTILSAQNLKASYSSQSLLKKSSSVPCLDDISFSLKEGSTLGVVGASGSGKSSLALALTRLINAQGTIHINGISTLSLSRKKWKHIQKLIQIVFQDPFGSLSPRMNIADIISEGLPVFFPQISKKQQQEKLLNTLNAVGLPPETLSKFPHEFSGGQRQRIAIARALIVEPKILILDEPTSSLDTTIQLQILKLLAKIQKELNLSYIFISHDMHVIQAIADHIIIMKEGKIVEEGLATHILEHPQHPETKKLIQAANLLAQKTVIS
jgi:microcin C transport system ATP-binding protein